MMINPKDSAPRMLMIISSPKGTEKAGALLEKEKASSQYRFHAQGTASREMISMLGLGSPEKMVNLCMMPRVMAEKMLKKLDQALRLGNADSGIAFTLPISAGSNQVLRIINRLMPEENRQPAKEDLTNMKEVTHALIAVIANHGYSDDIMAAARPAGASGGTVIHSRKVSDEESAKFWEFSVQEDKEVVLIVAANDKKKAIMQAISDKCGLHSDAKGLILSLPVDSIIGLADPNE